MSPLVTSLVVLVVLCGGWIQSVDAHAIERSWRTLHSSSISGSGLSSLDEVRGNGSMLLDTTTLRGKRDLIFPSLNFTCNGTIKRLIFLVEQNEFKSNYFEFGLWSPTHQRNRVLNISTANRFERSGIAYAIKPKRGSFVEGDMFRIHQDGTSLRYHLFLDEKKKVQVCNNNSMCEAERIGYPLVAVETDPAGCANGFVDMAALRYIMAATELTSHSTNVQYDRRIYFRCNGTFINKWTVGARITGVDKEKALMINIKKPLNVIIKPIQLNSLNTTSYLNVYDHNHRVKVCEGQYIEVNSSQVYYKRCGVFFNSGQQCIDQPLVAVSASCPGNCRRCTQGFIDVEELREKARYIPNFAAGKEVKGMNIPFPHLNITQDGSLTRWTFTAEDLGEGNGRMKYPELLILASNSECDDMDCDAVHHLHGSQSVSTIYPNVYEYSVDPPLPVKRGYYIAVLQPPEEDARMLLSFVKRPREGTIYLGTNQTDDPDYYYHPLLHLEIATVMESTTASPSLATAVESTTASPSVTGAVVGGIVAVLIILIAAILIAVVVILLVRRRRGSTQLMEGTTNPIYEKKAESAVSEARDEVQDEPQYAEVTEPPIYAEPTMISQEPNGIEIPPLHEVTTNGPTSDAPSEAPPKDYVQPETSPKIDSLNNPDYLYTQPYMKTESHYEVVVYVPTKEQRERLTNETHMYATLEEVQIKEQETLTFFEECDIYWKPSFTRDELYAQLAYRRYREIPSYQISVTESLGSGQFGTVSKGVWQGGKRSVEVAVKMLQEGTSEEDTVRFLQEAAIMGQFRHPNIVELLGVVTVGKQVMIVTELVHNGDLRTYLLSTFSHDPGELPMSDTAGLLSQFCLQVARGMDYLSSKAFIHRDLAARNILVTEHKTCKISDFGMSRDLEENSYYICQGGRIPIKWTAPEALQYKKYSTASDVWSFGCLMYEIWSLGHKPFEGYTNQQTIDLVDTGYRLAPPPGCPLAMYQVMITCWNPDKSARPQFREIVKTLSQPEHELLHIPEEVSRGHPQASILGAPLEAGSNLYTELQNTYSNEQS